MARGRMLNNKVSASRQMNDLLPDDTCRLLATWLISHLDKNGVFYGEPVMVKSLVFPRRADVTVDQIEYYLQAMEHAELIVRFQARGETWLWYPSFPDNQVGLRAERESSDFPLPPAMDEEPPEDEWVDDSLPEVCRKDAGSLPESIRQDAGKLPAEVKLREDKVKLSEDETKRPADAGTHPPDDPKPPKKQRAKASSSTPEAILRFRQAASRYPAKSWYADVGEIVGADPPDLDRWEAIVKDWVGSGWNPTNVRGMLDKFQGKAPPSADTGPDGRRVIKVGQI